MSTPTATPQVSTPTSDERPEPRAGEPGLARLLFGGLLVLLGLAWLVEATGLLSISWQTILSVALMGIGGVLLVTGRRGGADGLIGLGVVLSVALLLVASFPSFALHGGMGDRLHRPTSMTELEDRYELGAGDLVLDLRELELPAGPTEVTVELGMGELVVRVPDDATVEVDASAGMGDVDVLGRRGSGFGPSVTHAEPGQGDARLSLDLSTGMGSIEVTR